MNKLTKASIAGAAGILLLMGGAGTLAAWNSTAETAASAITAGTLDIEYLDGTGEWLDKPALIVPGDTFTYRAQFEVTAQGDNLVATATLNDKGISPANGSVAADVALADLLNGNVSFTINGQPAASYVPAIGTNTITVEATVNWPDSVNDNDAKNGNVSFDGFAVVLQQTP